LAQGLPERSQPGRPEADRRRDENGLTLKGKYRKRFGIATRLTSHCEKPVHNHLLPTSRRAFGIGFAGRNSAQS
jgi:hypothetical protein